MKMMPLIPVQICYAQREPEHKDCDEGQRHPCICVDSAQEAGQPRRVRLLCPVHECYRDGPVPARRSDFAILRILIRSTIEANPSRNKLNWVPVELDQLTGRSASRSPAL